LRSRRHRIGARRRHRFDPKCRQLLGTDYMDRTDHTDQAGGTDQNPCNPCNPRNLCSAVQRSRRRRIGARRRHRFDPKCRQLLGTDYTDRTDHTDQAGCTDHIRAIPTVIAAGAGSYTTTR
jgi:hypothetical protein